MLPCSFTMFFQLIPLPVRFSFFFFNDTATTEIYTLSLHDALPISSMGKQTHRSMRDPELRPKGPVRSEEHTSELQSPDHLVCRLLLEKKKTYNDLLHQGKEVAVRLHDAAAYKTVLWSVRYTR